MYDLWFHPLARFPGPVWNAFSNLPASKATLQGVYPFYLHSLHERYGDVVRVRPGTLSFVSSQAANDILTNKPGRGQLMKDQGVYSKSVNGSYSILSTPSDADHSRYRRLLAHGFSEKAVREQEVVVKSYVDLLIQKLHKNAGKGPQDMVAWFNWTTFDLIGDLTFDRSFDCLENEAYHEWIPFVAGGIKSVLIMSEINRYPIVGRILSWLVRDKVQHAGKKGYQFTKARVEHRMASATDRLDFLGYILRHQGKETAMSLGEIEASSTILVLGGSETTATLLAGTLYYLLQNPKVKQEVLAETRQMFANEDEINMTSVNKLSFLRAVLDETMRMYPPVTLGSPRVVGEKSTVIGGYMVPAKVNSKPLFFRCLKQRNLTQDQTRVIDSRYAACHYSKNFRNAESFVPERWLNDPAYANDDKGAAQPFSLGPRNCIGRKYVTTQAAGIVLKK